jgi:hypothetical protein
VLVGGPYPGHRHDRADRILARARGADVLVVAPTLPVPGERWVIDLEARQAQARANLNGWIDALAGHAEQIRGELGDERPGLAVAMRSTASPPTSTSTPWAVKALRRRSERRSSGYGISSRRRLRHVRCGSATCSLRAPLP